jgi:signal transduction histidine kinase
MAGALLLLAVAAGADFLPSLDSAGYPALIRYGIFAALSLAGTATFFGAAQRQDLPPGITRTYRLVASALAIGSTTQLLRLDPAWSSPLQFTLIGILSVASHAVVLVGVVLLPRRPTSRPDRIRLVLDGAAMLIVVGVQYVVLSALADTATDKAALKLATLGPTAIVEAITLSVINVIAVRGRPLPSPRAHWTSIGGLVFLILTQTVVQLVAVGAIGEMRYRDVCYIFALGVFAMAGEFHRTDPVKPRTSANEPRWLLAYNPLPSLLTIGIVALLLLCLMRGQMYAATLCAAGLLPLFLLLTVRVHVTTAESIQLLQEDAVHEEELQAAKMEAIGRLAGGIAHEFNNLMMTVIGHAELGVSDAKADGPLREDFGRILEAGQRAASLTSQLLHFSGKQITIRERVRIGELIRSLRRALTLAAGAVPVEFTFDADDPEVLADPAQMTQVALQLVGNARDSIVGPGRILMTVRTVTLNSALPTLFLQVESGRYVLLETTDTGYGIQPDQLPRIFDPFFTIGDGRPSPGLGLAAVHGIVAAHHGGLMVESAPGLGSKFRIYIPVTG